MNIIEECCKKWSEKLCMSDGEIKNEYDKLLNEEKNIHKELSDVDRESRALQRLALMFKKQLRSPAVNFEGIIIGVSDAVDIVAKTRRDAIEFFKTNPQKAIELGLCDVNGVPLDNRKEWNDGRLNINYGKPLPEHNWLKNICGIALKTIDKEGKPKFFTMTVTGEMALKEDIPLFNGIKFRAIDRTAPENINNTYTLNASTFTKFDICDTKLPNVKELITTYCKDKIVKIKDLQTYHNKVREDFNRLAIVEGDVSSLNLDVPATRSSRIMVIEENVDLENLEQKGTMCWVPLRVPIDFNEGSKVLVVGRTGQSKKKDVEGKPTEELGDVSINVFGVYAYPEYKITPIIKEVKEESVDFNTKQDW